MKSSQEGLIKYGRFPQGLERLRKKSIRQLVRNGPGLKPLEFAGIFAGLKPCAPTEKHKARIFPQPLKPRRKAYF